MRSSFSLRALTLAGLLSTAFSAPTGDKKRDNVFVDRAAAPEATPYGPPGSSGSLRGSTDLLGYTPGQDVSTPDTVIPASDYQLAPNQAADSDVGLYLDLSEVQNPQPIRGTPTNSPTDPGPRT